MTINSFSLYFMNFMLRIMLDAACDVLRVYYRSISLERLKLESLNFVYLQAISSVSLRMTDHS